METNLEEILSLMPHVTISPKAFIRFMELEEAEHERNREKLLGTVKSDNVGVYKRRELALRNIPLVKGKYTIRTKGKDEVVRIASFTTIQLDRLTDSIFFELMDNIKP